MRDPRSDEYDVVVIGAGPAGYVAAIRAAQLGLRTACVERRATLGGTCLNVGCIPSKALLHASELFEEASTGAWAKFGIDLAGATLDLARMHAEKDKAVKELTGGIEGLFRKNKVTWLEGQASFVDKGTIRVVSAPGDERLVTSRHVVVATGSSVTALPGVQLDGQVVVDSTGALALPRVPDHLVVIGGGVIGLELGSVWRRLGARVTVVEYVDQIMPEFDDEVRAEAARLFRRQGLEIRTSTKVTAAAVKDGVATLSLEPAAGGPGEALSADAVLVSIGRRANTDGLDLGAVGLSTNARGQIQVDEHFATAVPGIWAVGDCVPGPMLAHKAEDEGLAVADNIAGQPGIVNPDIIPSVIYTMPEMAGVGLTERAARERGEIRVGRFPFAANSRAKTNRDTDGFVKVVADAATDRVLGVWIVSSLAGTLIAQAAQAMEFGASSEDIAYTCHAHPTHAEALKEAAMAVKGKAIHM